MRLVAQQARPSRPTAPNPKQDESIKVLSLEDVQTSVAAIRTHFGNTSEAERLCAPGAYALLLWFMLSGLRSRRARPAGRAGYRRSCGSVLW